jgi:long-chain acyl-CoA synthetase
VPDPAFGEAVAVYVVLKPGQEASADTLTAWCLERMASYKKPKHYRFVSSLPENSTGKVLKRMLREEFLKAAA